MGNSEGLELLGGVHDRHLDCDALLPLPAELGRTFGINRSLKAVGEVFVEDDASALVRWRDGTLDDRQPAGLESIGEPLAAVGCVARVSFQSDNSIALGEVIGRVLAAMHADVEDQVVLDQDGLLAG